MLEFLDFVILPSREESPIQMPLKFTYNLTYPVSVVYANNFKLACSWMEFLYNFNHFILSDLKRLCQTQKNFGNTSCCLLCILKKGEAEKMGLNNNSDAAMHWFFDLTGCKVIIYCREDVNSIHSELNPFQSCLYWYYACLKSNPSSFHYINQLLMLSDEHNKKQFKRAIEQYSVDMRGGGAKQTSLRFKRLVTDDKFKGRVKHNNEHGKNLYISFVS